MRAAGYDYETQHDHPDGQHHQHDWYYADNDQYLKAATQPRTFTGYDGQGQDDDQQLEHVTA